MPSYRVLVTGSRTWNDEGIVYNALDHCLVDSILERKTLVVIHGACPTGADSMADAWALENGLVPDQTLERHPADWRTGRGAGVLRNAKMVNSGADTLLAFLEPCTKPTCSRRQPHDSHGATNACTWARKAGISVQEFRADR